MKPPLLLLPSLLLLGLVTVAGAQDSFFIGRAKPADDAVVVPTEAGLVPVQTGEPKAKQKEPEKKKGKEQPPAPPQPATPPDDLFANAPAPGGEAPVGLSPHMIGDFPGMFSLQRLLLPTTQLLTTTESVVGGTRVILIKQPDGTVKRVVVPIFVNVPVTRSVVNVVPVVTRVPLGLGGGGKVADNQGPTPQDRAYLSFNYYNGLRGANDPGAGQASTQMTTANGLPATVTTINPGPPAVNLYRQMFGFEKTFLDGSASIGMRQPFAQLQGDGSVGQQDLGDMSWIVNYAFYRDRTTGNLLSAGLMATLPTGPPQYTVAGNLHPALMQPFVGYRWASDRFYLQGFSSSAVPTDPRYVLAMFNDVGAGFWLYRSPGNAFISALIPTVEAHVTTPLNHRSADSLVSVPDLVALTAGVHVGFRNRALLTIGATVPVTGPRVFPIEAAAQFGYRY